jgi:hypothetical protein
MLHFHGRFIFQMPEYNNEPSNDATTDTNARFNPALHGHEVYKICGCDPAHYFEFLFRNVRVNEVTYRDGTTATLTNINTNNIQEDSILGQRIRLNGIMTDVSPSAVGAQLFAATMKVGNLLSGKLRKAVQSDLRTNIRPLNSIDPFDQENAGAHFETILDLSDKTSPEGSRFLRELGNLTQLEFYMHTNRYTIWNTRTGYSKDRLNGDVYGYIRPVGQVIDNNGVRIKGRRLIAHPDIENSSKQIARTFLGTSPLTRNTDIDGTYDILTANRLLLIRYLDFIPQLDRDYNTPTDKGIVKEYVVFFTDKQNSGHRIEVGRFKGDYAEMKRTGGILVFKIPTNVPISREDLVVAIYVVPKDNEKKDVPLMIESEWDIVLESERGLTLGSEQSADIIARVYHMNQPAHNCSVRLLIQPSGEMRFNTRRNRRSPIVARWKDDKEKLTTDVDGRVVAKVQAIDLENSLEVFDPVENRYVKGELRWDRYYGNYVYMEINNDMRNFQYRAVEQIEIPVRVLHKVKNLDSISTTDIITFKNTLFPKLLKYYVRYFPWLHTLETADEHYMQFLNFESYDEVRDSITEMIRRLSLDDNEWNKMPRSRDFPVGGVELIIRWLIAGMPE